MLVFVKLSSLTFRIPRLALCNLSSISALPSPPAHPFFTPGLGGSRRRPTGLSTQNANQALGGTSHDFPPRQELLFCY
ncbi:hypothetical protein PBY51_005022 [Eleginops maclovinus]|uniref:Uncharacterized protein n=1 Tax=Eleginops maclovinus TaxID=56733 RepID=A0AAN7X4P9_ELEMC|nr:hypothetical protein PBY51_005022 [Eleginops maclovinus]